METTISSKSKRDIKRKLAVLNYAKETGNVIKACRHFGISKTIFYKWKAKYTCEGEKGLIR
jgi:transposase-like protein